MQLLMCVLSVEPGARSRASWAFYDISGGGIADPGASAGVAPEEDRPAFRAPDDPDIPEVALATAAGASRDLHLGLCRQVHARVQFLDPEPEARQVLRAMSAVTVPEHART